MTTQEQQRLARLINDPPQGSKLAAARDFGIDLSLLYHNLQLTPTERFEQWLSALALHDELRRAGAALRKNG
jgi:hypothetical protein